MDASNAHSCLYWGQNWVWSLAEPMSHKPTSTTHSITYLGTLRAKLNKKITVDIWFFFVLGKNWLKLAPYGMFLLLKLLPVDGTPITTGLVWGTWWQDWSSKLWSCSLESMDSGEAWDLLQTTSMLVCVDLQLCAKNSVIIVNV